MHVSRLYIKNYRSIKAIDLALHKGKNVIVGRNNAGKSNIVKALDLVLGESSPDYSKSENITTNDFHTYNITDDDGEKSTVSETEMFIWCEITREAGEDLAWDEMYKCYGFYRCNERRYEPMRFGNLPEEYVSAFEIDGDEHPEKWYINPKKRSQQTLEDEFSNVFRFAIAVVARREEGKIKKEARLFYRESDDEQWMMAFKASIRCELLQSAIIKSFRDPQQELRLSSWSWYGKLIKHLTDNHASLPELNKAYGEVTKIANGIFSEVRTQVTGSALKVTFPGTELLFQLNPDTQSELYKSCLIYVDDGFKSLLTDKGSGIQSATIMGLFTYYVQNVSTSSTALLCVEEPELFLHPHARRVINDRLTEFLGQKNQVIITTHSGEFLRSDGHEVHLVSVRHNREQGTTCREIDIQKYSGLLVSDSANELFFADKVIICEGYDEFIVRALARELYPGEIDAKNVSVIAVGGKNNFAKMAMLVRDLGVQCFVLADFDYLLRDKDESAKKKYDASPSDSVLSLKRWFFEQECTFGSASMFQRIEKLRAEIKRDDSKGFYTAKDMGDLADTSGILELLEECRTHGLCILLGQIEDCCIDDSFTRTRKLNLERVFKLNQRLAKGHKITSIFEEDGQIGDFLKHVFSV